MADFALSEEDYAWLAQYDLCTRQSGDMRKTHSHSCTLRQTYRFRLLRQVGQPALADTVPHLDFAFASAPQEDEALRLR